MKNKFFQDIYFKIKISFSDISGLSKYLGKSVVKHQEIQKAI